MKTTSSKPPFAGPFKRLFSFVIDFMILMILFLILNLPFGVSASWNYESDLGLVTKVIYSQPLNALLFLIALVLYFSLTEGFLAASLGKLMFRMRVVDQKKERISLKTAFLRNVLTPIDLLFGPAFFFFSDKNQTLGDRVAKTLVINKNADSSVSNVPVSLLRKVFAVLFSITPGAILVLTLWTIPKVFDFNQLSRQMVETVKSKSATDLTGLYNDSFSQEFKETFSLEQLQQIFGAPEFTEELNRLSPEKIIFYSWEFNADRALIMAKTDQENDLLMRLQWQKDMAGEWKLLGFTIFPEA